MRRGQLNVTCAPSGSTVHAEIRRETSVLQPRGDGCPDLTIVIVLQPEHRRTFDLTTLMVPLGSQDATVQPVGRQHRALRWWSRLLQLGGDHGPRLHIRVPLGSAQIFC